MLTPASEVGGGLLFPRYWKSIWKYDVEEKKKLQKDIDLKRHLFYAFLLENGLNKFQFGIVQMTIIITL